METPMLTSGDKRWVMVRTVALYASDDLVEYMSESCVRSAGESSRTTCSREGDGSAEKAEGLEDGNDHQREQRPDGDAKGDKCFESKQVYLQTVSSPLSA